MKKLLLFITLLTVISMKAAIHFEGKGMKETGYGYGAGHMPEISNRKTALENDTENIQVEDVDVDLDEEVED